MFTISTSLVLKSCPTSNNIGNCWKLLNLVNNACCGILQILFVYNHPCFHCIYDLDKETDCLVLPVDNLQWSSLGIQHLCCFVVPDWRYLSVILGSSLLLVSLFVQVLEVWYLLPQNMHMLSFLPVIFGVQYMLAVCDLDLAQLQ